MVYFKSSSLRALLMLSENIRPMLALQGTLREIETKASISIVQRARVESQFCYMLFDHYFFCPNLSVNEVVVSFQ